MASIAEVSPYVTCGLGCVNAGHLSLPFPPADAEGALTQKWPSLCHGSSGPDCSNVFLPSMPWQTLEWDISKDPVKMTDSNVPNSTPTESVTSRSEGSLNAIVRDYQHDQISPGRGHSPSATSSRASDHLTSVSPPSLQSSKEPPSPKKQARPRKSSAEQGGISQRRRRTKTAQEQEASRARVREKNRVAADKCRGRQRIATERLSSKHDVLEDQNRQLSQMLSDLVAERIMLKNMLLEHGNCGCELIENYLRDCAARWVKQVESLAVNVEAA